MKKGKNVLEEKDFADYVLQKRHVEREGMHNGIDYDLKIPKNANSFIKIYGEGELLRMAIASLKTENDDAIEQSGKPLSLDKAFRSAFKVATAEKRKEIAKMLGISLEQLEAMEKTATAESKAKSKK